MQALTINQMEKLLFEMNLEEKINLSEVSQDDIFLYVGRLNILFPKELMQDLTMKFSIVPASTEFFAILLKRNSNGEFYDIESNMKVKTNLEPSVFELNVENSSDLINANIDFINIDLERCVLFNDHIKKIYNQIKDNSEKCDLAEILEKLRPTIKNKINECIRKSTYINGIIKKILLENNAKELCYKTTPEIDEYFGYAGPIYLLSAYKMEVNKVQESISEKTSFYPSILEKKTPYPLLFKRIDDTHAVEVSSGIKFCFQISSFEAYDYDKYSKNPLFIKNPFYLKPSEYYKYIYAKTSDDFFLKWINSLEQDARELYKIHVNLAIRECFSQSHEANNLEHKKIKEGI